MTINEIEDYLTKKHVSMDQDVFDEIELYRVNAIKDLNESQANYCWCLKTIYNVKKTFISAYSAMKSGEYELGWKELDSTDILLSGLTQNMDLDVENDKYNLLFISNIIKEYQKLFPYRYFLSRECIIKSERCSICGALVSIRNLCGHKLGKLYMGEQCVYEVLDFEFKGVSIVTDPFDKYAYIKIEGKEYNYGMVEELMRTISSPYDNFWIKTIKIKKPEYENVKRNDRCPCGSGKKYKKCHYGKNDEMMDHNIIYIDKAINVDERIRYIDRWKD